MNVCKSADANCIYNPLLIEYDSASSMSAGWERSAERSYASTAEIAAPADWANAEKFTGSTEGGIEYPQKAFERCHSLDDCEMVQCQDKDGDDKYACRFYSDQEVYTGDDAKWSAIGDAGSATITTW